MKTKHVGWALQRKDGSLVSGYAEWGTDEDAQTCLIHHLLWDYRLKRKPRTIRTVKLYIEEKGGAGKEKSKRENPIPDH